LGGTEGHDLSSIRATPFVDLWRATLRKFQSFTQSVRQWIGLFSCLSFLASSRISQLFFLCGEQLDGGFASGISRAFKIALLALLILIVTPLLRPPTGLFDWLFLASLVGVVIWQFTWFGPYLPGAPRAVQSSTRIESDLNRIAVLTTNVLQSNRGAQRLLKIIGDADADLILAVEVDEWWTESLKDALRSRYAHNICYPLSNEYGLALFSRLELIEPEVRFILDDAIPSIRTQVRLRSGALVSVYGVHPRPPAIQQDSTERDVELLRVGLEIKACQKPAIVLGDLNDVAWSPTTLNLMRAGDLLDPRRGRGFYNTYPANWPGLRYPLDYVFSTRHFNILGMRVLPDFGSDHLPLIAELTLEPNR
jgi:endonuclease/exonuclease/phosphatase (EEP) superfamily protein YafD